MGYNVRFRSRRGFGDVDGWKWRDLAISMRFDFARELSPEKQRPIARLELAHGDGPMRKYVAAHHEMDRDAVLYVVAWFAPFVKAFYMWRHYRWFLELFMGRTGFLWHDQGALFSSYRIAPFVDRFAPAPQFLGKPRWVGGTNGRLVRSFYDVEWTNAEIFNDMFRWGRRLSSPKVEIREIPC